MAKGANDLHHVALPLGAFVDPARPRGYHIDFQNKVSVPDWPEPTDRDSVMWVDDVVQWGLGLYERYLVTHDRRWLDGALAAARYLVRHQEQDGLHAGGWTYRYPFPHTFSLRPPWLMGMAQGQAASLLTRAALETGEESFAHAALRGLEPLRRAIAAGGVAELLPTGGTLLEEYPTTPRSHVLNGAIFALWGLYDSWKGLDTEAVGAEFVLRSDDLAGALHLWDTGTWSRYDLYPHPLANIASPFYHRLHITQLAAHERLVDDPRLGERRARFEGYARRPDLQALAVARKVAFRLVRPRSRPARPLL